MASGEAAGDASARDSPLAPGGLCVPEPASSSAGEPPSRTPASETRSLTTSLGRGAAAGEPSLSSPPDADAAGVLLLLALPPLSLPPLLPPLLPLPPEPPMPGGELLPLPPVGDKAGDKAGVKQSAPRRLCTAVSTAVAAAAAVSAVAAAVSAAAA